MAKTIQIFSSPDMDEVVDYSSKPIEASGYYGGNGLHTIAIYTNNFKGRIFFEGTISNDPNSPEAVWVNIPVDDTKDYFEFPRDNPDNSSLNASHNYVNAFTFKANFLYIRFHIVRSYYLLTDSMKTSLKLYGTVNKITLSY